MIKFTQNQMVDLFCEYLKKKISTRTGTYNKADPTHYEKYSGELWILHGYEECWQEDQDGIPILHNGEKIPDEPDPEKIKISVDDVTWGIEFKFETSQGTESGYWSREFYNRERYPEGGEWMRTSKNFFRVLTDIWKYGTIHHPYDNECPHGSPAMYV